MKKLTFITILISLFANVSFAQDGHITYREFGNSHFFGRTVVHRSDAANLDTLTSLYSGTIAFDTLTNLVKIADTSGAWVNVSSSGNSLDAAYNGGRTITADAGAVQINGGFNATEGDIQFLNDSIDVPILGYTNVAGIYEYLGGTMVNAMAYFPQGLGTGIPEMRMIAVSGDTSSFLSIFRGTNAIDQLFTLESTYGNFGNFGYEVQIVSGHPQTKMFATSYDGATNLSVVNVDTMKIEFEFDGIVPLRCDSDTVRIGMTSGAVLNYKDGNQASGAVLTSSANGTANWAKIEDVDASGIPKYAGNAAATAAIGVGKFFIDTSDSNAVKVSE